MQVEAEAKRISEEARLLLETNTDLLSEMQNRRTQLEDLLGRAQEQQRQVCRFITATLKFIIICM